MGFPLSIDGAITGKGIAHGCPLLSPTDAPLKTATGFDVTGGVDTDEMFYLVHSTKELAKLAGRQWDDSESLFADKMNAV